MRRIKVLDEIVRYGIVTDIQKWWGVADREIAERHLNDYGDIYVDEQYLPIENEYTTDCIYERVCEMRKNESSLADEEYNL